MGDEFRFEDGENKEGAGRRVDSCSFAPPLFVRRKSKLATLRQLIFALRYTRKTAESARHLSAPSLFSPVHLNQTKQICKAYENYIQ